MKRLDVMVIALLAACLAPCLAPCLASGAPEDEAGTTEIIRKQLDAATDEQQKSLLHKQLGDILAEREDYSGAAPEYEAALSAPQVFSPEERLQMIERISWAGRLESAVKCLRKLLEVKPDYAEARVTLAKILSWQEHLDAAIAEADTVLAVEPHHRGALLVKADSLRWKGNKREAMTIYRALLAEEEEFGPRLGLAHSQLDTGDLNGARESMNMLKPRFPYQERDLKALANALDAVTVHRISLNSSFYSDTDNNDVNRYGALYNYQITPGAGLAAEYLHTYARDPSRAVHVDSLNARGTATIGDTLVVGAWTGIHQLDMISSRRFISWGGNAECSLGNVTLAAGASQDVVTDTAQLIENDIRVRTVRASLSFPLYDRLSFYSGYAWKEYNDSNHANDVTLSPTYALLTGNQNLRIGYRFRYLNYERQSRDGYFDPQNFTSHGVLISYSHEIGPFHLALDPYGGIQSFDRYGVRTSGDFFGGFSAAAGWKINRRVTADLSGEFGNYALGSTSGYQYYTINGRISFNF